MARSNEDSDEELDQKLLNREEHTRTWILSIGKKIVEEYFQCEKFELDEDEKTRKNLFLTNRNSDVYANLPSPKGAEPNTLDNKEFANEIFHRLVEKFTISEQNRGNYFSILAGTNLSQALIFPFVMMRFGGYYFLIPFIISTCFLTLPINYAQYTISQFSNQPPILIYSNLAPICTGIGLLVTVVQYATSSGLRYDHRFMSIVWEFVYLVIGKNNAENSYLDTLPNRIFNPRYQQAHYISAAVVFVGVVFIISLIGIRSYFRRIQHFVFYSSFLICAFTAMNCVENWDRQATVIIKLIGADSSQLWKSRTWIVATVQSLVIFSTADGTFLAVGAVNQFRNPIFADLLRAKIGGFLMILMFGTAFGMAALVGAGIFANEHRELSEDELRVLIHSDTQVYEFLYVYFFAQNMVQKMMMLVVAAMFCLWQTSSLMLMSESALHTVYGLISRTACPPRFSIRYISILFHCSLLLFAHLFLHDSKYVLFRLAPYVVSAQLLVFLLIDFKQIFAVFLTMSNRNRVRIYKFRKSIMVYYQFFLPSVFFCILWFDIQANGVKMLQLTFGPILLIGISQIIRCSLFSDYSQSFRMTDRFRPNFKKDFVEFRRQEKALEGKIKETWKWAELGRRIRNFWKKRR